MPLIKVAIKAVLTFVIIFALSTRQWSDFGFTGWLTKTGIGRQVGGEAGS
jgi:hypothetical protein